MPINRRKLYVNGLSTVLSSAVNRNDLIAWARSKGIDTFLYYGLKSWLGANDNNNYTIANTTNAVTLSNFIEQARNNGIKSHVAVISANKEFYDPYSKWETEDYFGMYSLPFGGNSTGIGGNKIVNNFNNYILGLFPNALNKTFLTTDPFADFSGINLECEYWLDHTSGAYNGSPGVQLGVTKSGYYNGYLASINSGMPAAQALDAEKLQNFRVWEKVAELHKFWSKGRGYNEAYIGWLKPSGYEQPEANSIVKHLSGFIPELTSLNLHAYRAASATNVPLNAYGVSLFNYTQSRLNYLGLAQAMKNPGNKFKVNIIYSFEPGVFSTPWMINNPTVTFDQLHTAFENAFNASTFQGKNYIEIDGYTLFAQTYARTVRP